MVRPHHLMSQTAYRFFTRAEYAFGGPGVRSLNRSGLRPAEKPGFFGLNGRSSNADVTHFADVVEGTNSYAPRAESFVFGQHDGPVHVIEIDLDAAVAEFPFQFHLVPLVQSPHDSFGGLFGNRQARGMVHDEDVVRMRIGGDGQMCVVEVGRILDAEEQTHVLVPVRLLRRKQLRLENEISEDLVGNERDVDWRTDGGLVMALLKQFQSGALVLLAEL